MFTFQAASLLCSRLFNMMSSTISGTLTARGFCLSRNSAVCLNNINHRRSIRARTNFWLSSITGDWGRSFIGRPPFMFIICEWENIQGKKLENNSCLDWFWLSSWVQPAEWKPKWPQVSSDSQHTDVPRETTYSHNYRIDSIHDEAKYVTENTNRQKETSTGCKKTGIWTEIM